MRYYGVLLAIGVALRWQTLHVTLSATKLQMARNQFWRTAAGRLAFSLGRVPAEKYCFLCKELATAFELSPKPDLVSNGYDIVFQSYSHGDIIVGLEWDCWTGFTVVAKSQESEPLVQQIGEWLFQTDWATEE